MKIKAVVLDIDGTLVNEDKNLPPENARILRSVSSRGVKIVLASGRMTACIDPFFDAIGIDGLIMAYNGALLRSERKKGRKIVFHRPLTADIVSELIVFSLKREYQLNLYFDDALYAQDNKALAPFRNIYTERTKADYRLTDIRRFMGSESSKAVLITDPVERERLHAFFQPRIKGAATLIRTDPEYLEFTAPGVDKGSALQALSDFLGISMADIMAVGDGPNDVDMVAMAGYGVAVQNAEDSVKKVARYVTDKTARQGAVAEILQKLAVGT